MSISDPHTGHRAVILSAWLMSLIVNIRQSLGSSMKCNVEPSLCTSKISQSEDNMVASNNNVKMSLRWVTLVHACTAIHLWQLAPLPED